MPYGFQPYRPVYLDTALAKPMPRAVPNQGAISAAKPSLGQRLGDLVAGGLQKAGVGDRKANRWGHKLFDAIDALTPVGAVTAANDTRRALSENRYLDAAGNALSTALSAIPEGKAGGALLHSIIAPLWHGSPHKFEKFALEKIGTGEGNQAYGHGLYFAENPETARYYQQAISGHVGNQQTAMGAADRAIGIYEDPEKAIESLRGQIDQINKMAAAAVARGRPLPAAFTERVAKEYEPAIDLIKQGYRPGGHLYEVKVDANPEDFLDYDIPAIQQKQAVRDLLQVPEGAPKWEDRELGSILKDALRQSSNKTPEDVALMIDNDYGLYQRAHNFAKSNMPAEQYKLADELGQSVGEYMANLSKPQLDIIGRQYATGDDLLRLYRGREEDLRKSGIAGVRYYDEGSRSAGEGTRNYVVFDPNLIDIINRH